MGSQFTYVLISKDFLRRGVIPGTKINVPSSILVASGPPEERKQLAQTLSSFPALVLLPSVPPSSKCQVATYLPRAIGSLVACALQIMGHSRLELGTHPPSVPCTRCLTPFPLLSDHPDSEPPSASSVTRPEVQSCTSFSSSSYGMRRMKSPLRRNPAVSEYHVMTPHAQFLHKERSSSRPFFFNSWVGFDGHQSTYRGFKHKYS